MILQRPLAHETNSARANHINNQLGIFEAAEVISQERIRLPDRFQLSSIGQNFGRAGDPNLIVRIIEVTQFHLWIGLNFRRFAVGFQVRDVDGETINFDWRNRPQPRLVAIHRRELGEFRLRDDLSRKVRQLPGRNGLRSGLRHDVLD